MNARRPRKVIRCCFICLWLALYGIEVLAQSTADDELGNLVWQAAKELESGNTDDARVLLDKAMLITDEPSPRLTLLIDQLNRTIEKATNLEGDTAVKDINKTELMLRAEQEMETSGFSKNSDLEAYLSQLSEATSALFN